MFQGSAFASACRRRNVLRLYQSTLNRVPIPQHSREIGWHNKKAFTTLGCEGFQEKFI